MSLTCKSSAITFRVYVTVYSHCARSQGGGYATAGLTDLVFPLGKLYQSVTNHIKQHDVCVADMTHLPRWQGGATWEQLLEDGTEVGSFKNSKWKLMSPDMPLSANGKGAVRNMR